MERLLTGVSTDSQLISSRGKKGMRNRRNSKHAESCRMDNPRPPAIPGGTGTQQKEVCQQ